VPAPPVAPTVPATVGSIVSVVEAPWPGGLGSEPGTETPTPSQQPGSAGAEGPVVVIQPPGSSSSDPSGAPGAGTGSLASQAPAAGAVLTQVRLSHAALPTIPVLQPLVEKITGGAELREGRVALEIPQLSDNGHSVPLKIMVASPMNERDYVRTIHVLSEKNPRPVIATYHLNPQCGRAEVSTRVRLNGEQRLLVIAAMSDGSFHAASASVIVTETACLDAT
jgi:sulfur-oxidizing protein SoxY